MEWTTLSMPMRIWLWFKTAARHHFVLTSVSPGAYDYFLPPQAHFAVMAKFSMTFPIWLPVSFLLLIRRSSMSCNLTHHLRRNTWLPRVRIRYFCHLCVLVHHCFFQVNGRLLFRLLPFFPICAAGSGCFRVHNHHPPMYNRTRQSNQGLQTSAMSLKPVFVAGLAGLSSLHIISAYAVNPGHSSLLLYDTTT